MSKSPFSNRSVEEWGNSLQQATSADDRYRALLAINSLGTEEAILDACRRSLGDADSGVRALAAKQIRGLRPRAGTEQPALEEAWLPIADLLETCLADEDPDVRFEAARTLTQVAPERAGARDVLLALLDDEGTQPLMLAVVVTALGERTDLGAGSLLPRFQKLLRHAQAEVRENTSAVICRWGAEVAPMVSELIAALDDDEPIVRENAAIALGRCDVSTAEVLCALQTATEDEDEGVAAAARDAAQNLKT